MSSSSKLDRLHVRIRNTRWFRYFAVFCRLALAAGFIPSGMQKVMGERFTVLAVNHPMGHYLDAFYQTGYYYTFVGLLQVTAAILLLIPRTALLGVVIYFPIILNICILSLAVRFDGSLFTSPLMVLACLYLFFWDYHRLKRILPFNRSSAFIAVPKQKGLRKKFSVMFFAGVFLTIVMVIITVMNIFSLYPRNTISECNKQCQDSANSQACIDFCDCIHIEGKSLNECLNEYNKISVDIP